MNLRAKSTLFTAAIATTVLGIALLLVYQLVSVANDPELARQIGWNLLFIGLSAGILAAGAAWWVVQRINLPLRRLAETMSVMAREGQLRSDFLAAGGGSEVRLIEETFRALTISLEESQRARERSYVEAVGAVVTAADARDHETTGHSFRVSLYAIALAKALGIRGEELKAIEWGSLLHDVGKMVVPDEILRKMGPLTADEWHIMKQHPTWGFDMLAEVSFLQASALQIIYSHHERWDGKGYPRGLAGEEIPLAARIFAVVDTYDAITSDRPYRRARPYQVAVNELFNGGRFYDSHEVWEDIWRSTTPEPRNLFQGLIQIAAALHQFLDLHRQEAPGRTLAKARVRLEPYAPVACGLDISDLLDQVALWESWLTAKQGDPPPVPVVKVLDPGAIA